MVKVLIGLMLIHAKILSAVPEIGIKDKVTNDYQAIQSVTKFHVQLV